MSTPTKVVLGVVSMVGIAAALFYRAFCRDLENALMIDDKMDYR